MSAVSEVAGVFRCEGEQLVCIHHVPAQPARQGVLIVVGGPQYRVGSHRQFLLLARRLASAGIAAMRFDYRGMGDSSGTLRGFEHIGPDLVCAVEEFRRQQPSVERVIVWGLCDAASAALLHRALHEHVHGLVLLNPWVTEGDVDEAMLVKHYYLGRLLSRRFWAALLHGEVKLLAGAWGFARALSRRLLRRTPPGSGDPPVGAGDGALSERMARGLQAFPGPVLLITSGKDLTAAEFLERAGRSARWQQCLHQPRVQQLHLAQANHTFSSAAWRETVEDATISWLSGAGGTSG